MSDIKLPPLPQPPMQYRGHAMYAESQMEDYARQCVLADRAERAETAQHLQIGKLVLGHLEGASVSSPLETATGFGNDTEHRFQISDGQDRFGVVIILTKLRSIAPTQQRGADDEDG